METALGKKTLELLEHGEKLIVSLKKWCDSLEEILKEIEPNEKPS